MSMFNDTDWKANDENSMSNAEKVNNFAMNFSQGHWTFLGLGLQVKWYGFHSPQNVQRFKETGHLVF